MATKTTAKTTRSKVGKHPRAAEFNAALARGGIQDMTGIRWNPYRMNPISNVDDADTDRAPAPGTVPVQVTQMAAPTPDTDVTPMTNTAPAAEGA